MSHCPPPPEPPTSCPCPVRCLRLSWEAFAIWGPHTSHSLWGHREHINSIPASAGRTAAYSQTSSPPQTQFKSESQPEGLPCARHWAQVGGKPEPVDFELAPRGGRDPMAGSGKPLTQELSPEGCGGIGKVKTGGLPGGGSSTAEAQRRQVGRCGHI